MCGRFTFTIDDILKLANRFQVASSSIQLKPRYNLAPSQEILTIIHCQGHRQLIPMQWGLIPFWDHKNPKKHILVNVRSENLEEKPIFKSYFERKRCLIPADGFFEWKKEGQKKIPFRAIVKNNPIFSFAGLWDYTYDHKGNSMHCFTILTTAANQLLSPIHNRMPVILTSDDEEKWLDPHLHFPDQLHPLLKPYPACYMDIYEVSTEVNSTRHDNPNCIVPCTKN